MCMCSFHVSIMLLVRHRSVTADFLRLYWVKIPALPHSLSTDHEHEIETHKQRLFAANDGARVAALALHPDDETMASCHLSGHDTDTKVVLRFWSWATFAQVSEPHNLTLMARKKKVPPIADVEHDVAQWIAQVRAAAPSPGPSHEP